VKVNILVCQQLCNNYLPVRDLLQEIGGHLGIERDQLTHVTTTRIMCMGRQKCSTEVSKCPIPYYVPKDKTYRM
jgi:hypothetical protein